MHVVRQREVNGNRNVFVAYGDETLTSGNGGYFSLELVSTKVSHVINIIADDKRNRSLYCRRHSMHDSVC
jgi:hypothetical protein